MSSPQTATERAPAKSFRELLVWQKAHALVLEVYRLTGSFPREEMFGLASQLRRAAVSIPANIVEGFRKQTSADKARYFNIAQASLDECLYYAVLVQDLGYGDGMALEQRLEEIGRLLHGYRAAVLKNHPPS